MKLYTEKEIFDYLTNNYKIYVEYGIADYSVSVDDDGNLICDGKPNDHQHDAVHFIYNPARYLGISQEEFDALEDLYLFFEKETMDDEDFREIVEDLTEKINAIIENL